VMLSFGTREEERERRDGGFGISIPQFSIA
jgi:hypothetical protein